MAKPVIDLLIKNVKTFNVFIKKFVDGDISVSQGRFFTVGKYDLNEYIIKKEIDGSGKVVVPGLIDIHLHVESSLVTPQSFADELIKHGVTTVVADPHEIGNVFGLNGIEAMIRAGQNSVCDIFYGVPSCVPATDLETAGAKIDFDDFLELSKEPQNICLGEVMSYVELVKEEDTRVHKLLQSIRENNPRTIIEGHCPNLMGVDLATFMYYGPDADHTMQSVETIDERIRMGMMVQLQDKSLTPEVIAHLENAGYDEHIALVTDDVAPDKLFYKGHLDHLVKKSISMGLSPEKALYWTTYTPARRMQLTDRGAIAPGKLADFIILDDVKDFKINQVYKKGDVVYSCAAKADFAEGRSREIFPDEFYKSVCLTPLCQEDFKVSAPQKSGAVTCRGMVTKDKTTYTEYAEFDLMIKNGYLEWQNSGWALAAVLHRHGKNSNKAYGLVSGAVLKQGAVATTYAHDSHNLLVVGHSPEEMVLAANRVISNQGGICVVRGNNILAEVKLPVAGLMCHESVEAAAEKLMSINQALSELGYKHSMPLMSLATLTLPVSPSIKLTDMGLVDVKSKKIVNLFKSIK